MKQEITYWVVAVVVIFFTMRVLKHFFPRPKGAGYVTNGASILPGQYRY